MSIELWLAFVAASAILLVIPGPTILTVISYSLTHGRRANAARCSRLDSVTGKVHPFLADPQVSSIAPQNPVTATCQQRRNP